MASPKPVPPNLRVVEASTWIKGENSFSRSSGTIPNPVSVIANRIVAVVAVSDHNSALTTTSPWLVNLIALPIKFIKICRKRPASPCRCVGTLR